MDKNKKLNIFDEVWKNIWSANDAVKSKIEFLSILKRDPQQDIVEWAEENWDLSFDETSRTKGKIKLFPWQKEFLREFQKGDNTHFILMAPSRTAKTTLLGIVAGWMLRFHGSPIGLMLENIDKSNSFIKNIVIPILSHVDYFYQWLNPGELKRRLRMGFLRLPLGSIRSFGSGVPATQYTLQVALCDEVDRHKTQSDNELQACESLAIRTETFAEQRRVIFSSTPGDQDLISKYYYNGSQGRWHIACLKCGYLWPSSTIGYKEPESGRLCGLQWKKNADGEPEKGSVRWHCPSCGHVAVEEEKWEMNNRGKFVHLHSDRPMKSFHLGCLALPYLEKGGWDNIAFNMHKCAHGTLDSKKIWTIEFLGMPYKPETKTKAEDRLSILKNKVRETPDSFKPSAVVAGVDVQSEDSKKYYKAVVSLIGEDGTVYQKVARRCDSVKQLEEVLDRDYNGRKLDLGIVDVRGFSNQSLNSDVMPIIQKRFPNVIGWQGMGSNTNASTAYGWTTHSTNNHILQFVDQKWQANALDAIYIADNRESIFFSPTTPDEFYNELVAMAPPKSDETAAFEKWKKGESESRNDYFDATKMCLAAKELIAQIEFMNRFQQFAPKYKWSNGIPEWIKRRLDEQLVRQGIKK